MAIAMLKLIFSKTEIEEAKHKKYYAYIILILAYSLFLGHIES